MANTANEDVEILIRAGAPSRPQDDARYKAMVSAYLTFEAAQLHNIDSIESRTNLQNIELESQLQEGLARAVHEERESAESWKPEGDNGTSASQDVETEGPASMSFMDSPEMSFRSVLHNNDSPFFRGQIVRDETVTATARRVSIDSERLWEPSTSIVADSQVASSLNLSAFISPTKALEEYYCRITNGQSTSQSVNSISRSVGEVMSSSRLRQTQKSSLPIAGVVCSSSPVAEPPSSPSPTKVAGQISGRVLKRLENGASPPKCLQTESGHQGEQSMTRLLDIEIHTSTLDCSESAIRMEKPTSLSTIVPSTLYASEGSRDMSASKSCLVAKTGTKRKLVSSTAAGRPTSAHVLIEVSRPPTKRARKVTERLVPPFQAPPPLHQVLGDTTKARAPFAEALRLVQSEAHTETSGRPFGSSDQEGQRGSDTRHATLSIQSPSPRRGQITTMVSFPLPNTNLAASSPALSATQPNTPTQVPTASKNIATSSLDNTISPYQDALTITPPTPSASHQILQPHNLITPFFTHLLSRMSLDNPFTPVSRTRPLRSFERGYWFLSCVTWTQELRVRAWDALGSFVGRDMTGWGVRCVRDEARDWIRIYCWGEVVECVWYLLFLVSEGKIKGCEHSWMGGDGKVVVVMK